MRIYSIFKNPKTNVFKRHLIIFKNIYNLQQNDVLGVKYGKKIALIFLYTLNKSRRKSKSSFSHSFQAVSPSLVMQQICSFIL